MTTPDNTPKPENHSFYLGWKVTMPDTQFDAVDTPDDEADSQTSAAPSDQSSLSSEALQEGSEND